MLLEFRPGSDHIMTQAPPVDALVFAELVRNEASVLAASPGRDLGLDRSSPLPSRYNHSSLRCGCGRRLQMIVVRSGVWLAFQTAWLARAFFFFFFFFFFGVCVRV